MSEPVKIVQYDPLWPSLYDEERARILGVLGDIVLDIEHIGSTAAPCLGAKPIIYIMVGLAELAAGDECIQPLESLGYEFRGEAGIPGRLYFRKGAPRTHHLHMVERESDFWQRHMLFRTSCAPTRRRPDSTTS